MEPKKSINVEMLDSDYTLQDYSGTSGKEVASSAAVSSIKFNESNLAFAESEHLKQSPRPVTRKTVTMN